MIIRLNTKATSVVSNATANIPVTFAIPSGVDASLAKPNDAAIPNTVPIKPTDGIAHAT